MSEKFGIFEKFADGRNGVWDRCSCTGGAKFAKTFAILHGGGAAEKLDALTKNLFFQGGELLANGWAGWLAGWAGWYSGW